MSSNKTDISNLPSPDQLVKMQTKTADISSLPSPAELGYVAPRQTSGNDLQDLKDLGLGAIQGVTFGGADELEGAVNALGKSLEDGSITDVDKLATLYHQYQKEAEKKYTEAKARSPYLYGTGQLVGAIAPAILTSGAGAALRGAGLAKSALGAAEAGEGLAEAASGAKALVPATEVATGAGEAAQAATGATQATAAPSMLSNVAEIALKGGAAGAAQGALESEGSLIGGTDEDRQKLLSDVGIGTAGGTVLGGLMGGAESLLGKAGQALPGYIQSKPLLRQLKTAKDLGEAGVDFGNPEDIERLGVTGIKGSEDIFKRIMQAKNDVGKQVESAATNAAKEGVTVPITSDMMDSAETIDKFFSLNPAIKLDSKSKVIFQSILAKSKNDLTFNEAQVLKDTLNDMINNISGDNTLIGRQTRNELMDFYKQVNGSMKDAYQPYNIASQQFDYFNKMIPETIITKGVDPSLIGFRMGDLNSPRKNLMDNIQEMLQGATMPGSTTQEAKTTLGALKNNLSQLDTDRSDLAKQIYGSMKVRNKDDLIDKIRSIADTNAIIKQAQGVNPQEGAQTLLKGIALGSTTGRGKLLGTANKIGKYANTLSTTDLSKGVFALPNDTLQGLASQLSMSGNENLANLGSYLMKGLSENNTANKNAALFSLLQNKDAREYLANMLPGPSLQEEQITSAPVAGQ